LFAGKPARVLVVVTIVDGEIPSTRIVRILTRDERAAIRRAAKEAKASTSAWVRTVALAALRDRRGGVTA